MTERRYFCRYTKVDGHTLGAMLAESDLVERVSKAIRNERMLRVEIERGDLNDLVLDYNASQIDKETEVRARTKPGQDLEELAERLRAISKQELARLLANELMARYPTSTTGERLGHACRSVPRGHASEASLRLIPGGKCQ